MSNKGLFVLVDWGVLVAEALRDSSREDTMSQQFC